MLPKTIYQYDKNNRLVRIWANSRECEKHGFDRRHIIKCCKGKRNTHKGFKWSYTDIIDIVVKEAIDIGSDFSGIGAFEQALIRLNVPYRNIFACEVDKYARQTYIINYGTLQDLELLKTEDVKFIDDIYYRGLVNTKLKTPTQKEWDKVNEIEERVANKFSFYYPWNVYSRKIPTKSLDIYMPSPPCQGFSLAGKRGGSILFYNSLEFIKKNNPRYFIFENVKGLLSHDKANKKSKYGKTFETWIKLLGGKSVNNIPTFFGCDDSINYHIHYRVLNAKHYGVPQNRERIFIIGTRDDVDNNFNWSLKVPLIKRLKDVLEENVDEKYYLSDKMIKGFLSKPGDFGNRFDPKEVTAETADCITARYFKMAVTDNYIKVKSDNQSVMIGAIRGRNDKIGKISQTLEIGSKDTSNTITSVQKDNVIVTDRIRRLTLRECFRLMDYPDTFKWDVSDSQAYKQAGNSIPIKFLELIIKSLLNL